MNKIDRLIKDITEYIGFLREKMRYSITLHFHDVRFNSLLAPLIECNIHDNIYCSIIKSNADMIRRCVHCQLHIINKSSDEPFLGMCHAGVEEYVFPLKLDKNIGFISVSGYRNDQKAAEKKIRRIAADSCLSEELLLDAYSKNLNPVLDNFDEVKTLIYPLCHLVIYLCEQVSELYCGTSYLDIKNFDNVYSRMIWFIDKNFTSRITIDDIAKHCGCSKSYISHLFKKHNNKSIVQYITALRIEKSKQLLLKSKLSVQEICSLVGFGDVSYFTTTFKKLCGMPPSSYRAENKL